jgi:Nucleotide-diphospho-sugar transferase
MQPLTNSSWEIQFQCDSMDYRQINIGWYWARPTATVREFFRRSQEQWNQTRNWDQRIMNDIRNQMIQEGSFSSSTSLILNLTDYKSSMLFDWAKFYANSTLIDQMNKEGVMVHYTMIFNLMKIVVAKHFGHWFNETYYKQTPRLLQPVNIAGTATEIRQQLEFSAYLAKFSGRTFMWPILVNQTYEQSPGVWTAFPAIYAAEPESIAKVAPWVEGTYLSNRAKYISSELSNTTISGTRNLSDLHSILSVMENSLSSVCDVLKVDFGAVDVSKSVI